LPFFFFLDRFSFVSGESSIDSDFDGNGEVSPVVRGNARMVSSLIFDIFTFIFVPEANSNTDPLYPKLQHRQKLGFASLQTAREIKRKI
jgi:hypothetical protein